MLQVIQSTINKILFKRNSSSYGPLNYIRTSRRITDAGLMACTSFILLMITILMPPYLVPENTEAATGTATESSITFKSSSTTASATLDVTSVNGNFATSTSSQQIAFSLSTTNYTGYTLKLKLSDSTNTLSNGADTLAMIANSATSDNFTNNSWGLLPSKYDSNDNTDIYYPVTTAGIIMHETSGANSTSNPNNYTISLGLKADYSKSAGTYANNKAILEYVANPVNYAVTYNKNTTDIVTNMPYADATNPYVQTGDTSATTITLSSLVPVRDGYNFKGWCSTAVSDGDTCSGATYNPDGDGTALNYGIDKTTLNTAELRAMWTKKDNTNYMQDVTLGQFNVMADGDTLTLTDKRDGQIYTAAKIAGLLWMTRNLAIGCNGTGSAYGSSMNGITLNSQTSNVAWDWSTPTASLKNGDSYDTPYMSCDSTYGAWYNYAAATAGTISTGTAYRDDIYNICPAGWTMPLASQVYKISGGGLELTSSAYVSDFSPVYSGRYSNGSLDYTNIRAMWWTRNWFRENDSVATRYFLRYYNNMLSSGKGNPRLGYNVRCVFESRAITDGVDTMQGVTKALANNTAEGTTYTLFDNRDEQSYSVAKINGNLWMTRNLAIGCSGSGGTYGGGRSSRTLTSSNSNVLYSWSTPTDTYDSSRTAPKMYCSSTYGAWYNFCAASAGATNSPTGCSDMVHRGSYDICPLGWRLPTLSEIRGVIGYDHIFAPVVGGYRGEESGRLVSSVGHWWSATALNGITQNALLYDGDNLAIVNGGMLTYKETGNYVRCVRSV